MSTMTLAVPNELKKKMHTFSDINWSEVARLAFQQRISDLEFLRQFKSKSTLTEQDALKLGAQLNKRLAKHYSG